MRVGRAIIAVVGLVGLAQLAMAAGWPHWRGPEWDDAMPEMSGWPKDGWPGDPAWVKEVGAGPTTPTVVADRVYVMGWANGKDSVICLDAATGNEIWRQSYPAPEWPRFHAGDEPWYHGPESTPSYDAATGLLFTLGADSELGCWDAKAGGKSVWRMNLYDTYKAPQRPDVGGGMRDHGYTTAPLILGDSLIVEVGAPEGNLMAFDKRTGKRLWVSQCKDEAGNSGGPVPITVAGVPCVALTTLRELVVVRTDRGHGGETAAAYPWRVTYGSTVPTPTVVGDRVLITNGLNISRTECLQISLDDGIRKLWASKAWARVCSPVVHGQRVYLAEGTLKCFDLATGEIKWTGRSFGDDGSCLATGDGKLVVYGNKQLALVDISDPNATACKELVLRPFPATMYCWPHPVIAGGRLYLKDGSGKLSCFRL